jgi:hypothetical protein
MRNIETLRREREASQMVNRYFTRKKVTPAPEVKTEDKEITENMRAYWIERQDCDPSVGAGE